MPSRGRHPGLIKIQQFFSALRQCKVVFLQVIRFLAKAPKLKTLPKWRWSISPEATLSWRCLLPVRFLQQLALCHVLRESTAPSTQISASISQQCSVPVMSRQSNAFVATGNRQTRVSEGLSAIETLPGQGMATAGLLCEVVQISLLGVDAMVESGGLAAPGALAAPLQVPLIQPTPNRPPLGTVPDVRQRQIRWNTP